MYSINQSLERAKQYDGGESVASVSHKGKELSCRELASRVKRAASLEVVYLVS